MKEFAADRGARVHPQTVVEHFGTWNAAKRAAGLLPRRFITREELLAELRRLGGELGRTPGARDLDDRRGRMPSPSLYWHTFGSLAAALGGLDALVFTAGIGEHAAPIRERICRQAEWLGIEIDDAANAAHAQRISQPGSKVSVWVIPTNEELMIAQHTKSIMGH